MCPEYDYLHAQWKDAHWKYAQTLNPIVREVTSDQRASIRKELLRIERELNTHVSGCVACLGDGHKPIFDSSRIVT
jgi:hypothetical protein